MGKPKPPPKDQYNCKLPLSVLDQLAAWAGTEGWDGPQVVLASLLVFENLPLSEKRRAASAALQFSKGRIDHHAALQASGGRTNEPVDRETAIRSVEELVRIAGLARKDRRRTG